MTTTAMAESYSTPPTHKIVYDEIVRNKSKTIINVASRFLLYSLLYIILVFERIRSQYTQYLCYFHRWIDQINYEVPSRL
jgi:hypothetical protein